MIEIAASICFALAILHTFSVKYFQHIANRYEDGSVGENFFHLLGEIEVVFGVWGGLFLIFFAATSGVKEMTHYLEGREFTEPAFVFVIMTICSTRPILRIAGWFIEALSNLLPLQRPLGFFVTALTVGPVLGSFITEPAAMTVVALILFDRFYAKNISSELKYATLGLLFVNISIGGTLTPYAAPPVLMVASKWGWDLPFMFSHFGWKAVVAIVASTALVAYRFRKEIGNVPWEKIRNSEEKIPIWVFATHLLVFDRDSALFSLYGAFRWDLPILFGPGLGDS